MAAGIQIFRRLSAAAIYLCVNAITRNRDIPKNAEINTFYVRLNEFGEVLPEDAQVVDREVWPDGKKEYIIFIYL